MSKNFHTLEKSSIIDAASKAAREVDRGTAIRQIKLEYQKYCHRHNEASFPHTAIITEVLGINAGSSTCLRHCRASAQPPRIACGHRVCKRCIGQWVGERGACQHEDSCPMCRSWLVKSCRRREPLQYDDFEDMALVHIVGTASCPSTRTIRYNCIISLNPYWFGATFLAWVERMNTSGYRSYPGWAFWFDRTREERSNFCKLFLYAKELLKAGANDEFANAKHLHERLYERILKKAEKGKGMASLTAAFGFKPFLDTVLRDVLTIMHERTCQASHEVPPNDMLHSGMNISHDTPHIRTNTTDDRPHTQMDTASNALHTRPDTACDILHTRMNTAQGAETDSSLSQIQTRL
ncbi:hypothetical protein H2201_002489 [Coniosporium apollinis]|uniref:RING-type domain-containing protein n=1 Tax=Coniosporium apollinis TaxID=61459 RepID=A0ABQ9NZ86_9PEZI|nr:hypothetical protein H2201_002489 [Coniosporium apollinis]